MINNIIDLIKNNKYKFIIVLVLIIFSIIMIIINNNKDHQKIFSNKKYVYTIEENDIDGFKSELPYINIKGDEIDNINKDMMVKYYTECLLKEKYASYEYYKNKNILSLLVKYQYIEAETDMSLEINFYNININTGQLLSNEELFDIYNVDDTVIEEKISEQIEEYYNYETKKNYISECDLECYKDYINSHILYDTSYYVKNNHLYAYRVFQTGRDFAIDDKKPFELFRFKIS